MYSVQSILCTQFRYVSEFRQQRKTDVRSNAVKNRFLGFIITYCRLRIRDVSNSMAVSNSVDASNSMNVSNNGMPARAGTPVTAGIPLFQH
jgi:hypothetical protein